MSLFAGIYSLDPSGKVDLKDAEIMKKAISGPRENVTHYSNNSFFLTKFDFGAFGDSGYFIDEEQAVVTTVAGEPILSVEGKESFSRQDDIRLMERQLQEGNIDILKSCHGTYSLCRYGQKDHSLILATDKLGARPLYYYIGEKYLYFSSSLRIIEAVQSIPKEFDLQAFVEEYYYCYPLGTKTKYLNINVLRDGQYLYCNNEKLNCKFYFRFDELSIEIDNYDLLLKESYNNFLSAVISRCKNINDVFCFLSGGLDSRCIASTLNLLCKNITALNSSRDGEQDQELAEKFATSIGARYFTSVRPVINNSTHGERTERLLAEATKAYPVNFHDQSFPKIIFSGDGGGELVGFLQIDDALLAAQGKGHFELIDEFNKKSYLPNRVLQPELLYEFKKMAIQGMENELNDLASLDSERRIYLFLIRNDLRRHLHEYHDNIDKHKVELLLPFYDSRLIETMIACSVPLGSLIKHKFYHRWLQLFDKSIMETPWQTYPGHQPCPLVINKNLMSQWEVNKKNHQDLSDNLIRKCFTGIFTMKSSIKFLNKKILFLYLIAHKLRLGDYSYILKFCSRYFDIIDKCDSLESRQ